MSTCSGKKSRTPASGAALAGLNPRSDLERIDPSTGGKDFKRNLAAQRRPLTNRVYMKNSSANSALEQIKDDLPRTGFVRLASILAPQGPIPVGRSTWWQGVKTGRFPKPVKLGPRTTAWKVEDIRTLIENAE